MNRDSSVDIAAGWTDGVRFPAGAGIFLFSAASRLALGVHPAFYPVGTGGSFTGLKRPGREADLSSPPPEVRNCGGIHPLPDTSSWHAA
jgi:hypothetical protein